jgi:hypothetical protein
MPVAYNPAASTKDRKVRVIAMRTTLAECIRRLTSLPFLAIIRYLTASSG